MKYYFFIIVILLSVLVNGCGTTMYQLNTACNTEVPQLFSEISSLLIQEGFIIKVNDPKTGYLQAETIPKMNIWLGMNEVRYWIFQAKEYKPSDSSIPVDNIIAYAKVSYIQQNLFGATTGGTETYYNDRVSKDWTWYWTVRKGLENICKNKIKFIEKTLN